MSRTIEVGQTVRYTTAFLQSTGMYTGPVPFARGQVIELNGPEDSRVATVAWHSDPGVPARVLACNLETCRRPPHDPVPVPLVPSRPVCPNCGQWQWPRAAGDDDCLNECAARGFSGPRRIDVVPRKLHLTTEED